MPIPAARFEPQGPVLLAQGIGQPASPGEGTSNMQAVPPGAERAEGAFGIFGMTISGLIVVFAVVLLFLRRRRR
jgi:hypothetical protein